MIPWREEEEFDFLHPFRRRRRRHRFAAAFIRYTISFSTRVRSFSILKRLR